MCPQASLGCEGLLDFLCFWWILQLEDYWPGILQDISQSGFVRYFFPWLEWGYGFPGRRLEVKCHSYHIISRLCTVDMTCHCCCFLSKAMTAWPELLTEPLLCARHWPGEPRLSLRAYARPLVIIFKWETEALTNKSLSQGHTARRSQGPDLNPDWAGQSRALPPTPRVSSHLTYRATAV